MQMKIVAYSNFKHHGKTVDKFVDNYNCVFTYIRTQFFTVKNSHVDNFLRDIIKL
jgi:hypothetical protein